ncbi:MAG: hypothetical protein FWG02_11690 [Holophagaceae bacterium]|nr:hypothetical protein [Holophagaceae bacterium]
MLKSLLLFWSVIVFSLPLLSQRDFMQGISRHRGHKIVLLGKWSQEDKVRWKQIVDSSDIFDFRFVLVDGTNIGNRVNDGSHYSLNFGINFGAFERWFIQQYGISGSARWVALDLENKLIATGLQVPDGKEFGLMLAQRGIKGALAQVRNFLSENPCHLEATGDLLTEVRRRSLHLMPPDTDKDLDEEADLHIWGSFASEIDRVFNGEWEGLNLYFFKADSEMSERFSPLMKNVFRKHLPKIESAIRLDPFKQALWDTWGWMSQSTPDYYWKTFIDTIEKFHPRYENTVEDALLSPPANICVWLVADCKKRGDWETLLKFAEMAENFGLVYDPVDFGTDWSPGPGGKGRFSGRATLIDGYPVKTAILPHLEALLRLGRVDEASNLYGRILRRYNWGLPLAIALVRSIGMEDLAQRWELEEGIPVNNPITPYFYVFAKPLADFDRQFNGFVRRLSPNMLPSSRVWSNDNRFDWKMEEGERWALLTPEGKILIEGSEFSDTNLAAVQEIIWSQGVFGSIETLRKHLVSDGSNPGIELALARQIISQNNSRVTSPDTDQLLDDEQDLFLWGEAFLLLRRVLNSPHLLTNLVSFNDAQAVKKSRLMKLLAGSYLASVESALERQPTANGLWYEWIFWRDVEGAERSLVPLIERLKYSPLSPLKGMVPGFVMTKYYEECRQKEDWPKVIKLLKSAWDRELAWNNFRPSEDEEGPVAKEQRQMYFARAGGNLGIPLIEAYLHNNNPNLASEIFDVYIESGGKFTDISKIVELAKEKGYESLARKWEEKIPTLTL